MRRITIMRHVSAEIVRLCGGDKEAILSVYTKLRNDLGAHPEKYRRNRAEKEPDCLFNYHTGLFLGGRWLLLRFTVSDTTSPDDFLVEAVSSI